jgi:hypothetical protein
MRLSQTFASMFMMSGFLSGVIAPINAVAQNLQAKPRL